MILIYIKDMEVEPVWTSTTTSDITSKLHSKALFVIYNSTVLLQNNFDISSNNKLYNKRSFPFQVYLFHPKKRKSGLKGHHVLFTAEVPNTQWSYSSSSQTNPCRVNQLLSARGQRRMLTPTMILIISHLSSEQMSTRRSILMASGTIQCGNLPGLE